VLSLQLIDGLEAGTDEAGRGCLAGPVTAAAVILPADFNQPLLNDSKKLTEKQRFYLRPIIEKHAIAFAVAHCTPKKVDEINILNAAIKAMHKAIQKLKPTPIHILVDGNRFHPFKKYHINVLLKVMENIKTLPQLQSSLNI